MMMTSSSNATTQEPLTSERGATRVPTGALCRLLSGADLHFGLVVDGSTLAHVYSVRCCVEASSLRADEKERALTEALVEQQSSRANGQDDVHGEGGEMAGTAQDMQIMNCTHTRRCFNCASLRDRCSAAA